MVVNVHVLSETPLFAASPKG